MDNLPCGLCYDEKRKDRSHGSGIGGKLLWKANGAAVRRKIDPSVRATPRRSWWSIMDNPTSWYPERTASLPSTSDGRIYLSDIEGTIFVVKAGREFELLLANRLGERITASPAVSGNELFYRTDSHVYCIGENIRH